MFKKLVAVFLSVAMVCSLAACGKSETSANTTKEGAAQDGKTIELWTCWTEGADTAKASLEYIKKWEEKTGNIVNQTNFTYDMLHEKILTAAAGGNVPDLVWGLPEYVGEFYNMGIVEDLTDRFQSWEDKDALSESVVKAMTIDDKIVGIPYEMTVRAYLVHSNDLAAAGVETPKTWEDLLALKDFKEKTGKYPTELACTGVRQPQELLVYLAQKGVEIATAQEDGKYRNSWNENPSELKKAAEVFQFYQDLMEQGIVDPSAKNWGWEETDENFATGIAATYVTGNWLEERETSNPDTMGDINVSAIPYPADGKQATYMECKPLFVMEGSQNKEEAFSLATAFCSYEWQNAAFTARSPRLDVSADTKWSKDFSALSDTGITFPPVTLAGINQAMIDSVAKVLQEGKTPLEAAAWLCEAVNASLADSGELSE